MGRHWEYRGHGVPTQLCRIFFEGSSIQGVGDDRGEVATLCYADREEYD